MVFSSPIFIFLFLPLVLLVYFLLKGTARKNLCLLVFSLLFYFWGETYLVLLMLLSIGLNYFFGIQIDKQKDGKRKKQVLLMGVAINLLILISFKYANFIVDNLNTILVQLSFSPIHLKSIHLPIGISFFTFQSMSYIIDVYRNTNKVSRSLTNVALYISLFPQLIAGPIVRYHDVAGQIIDRNIKVELFAAGAKRFIIGLAKKVLIANTVARVADHIFDLPIGEHTIAVAWLGAVAYSLQIYFDFSGYSDMAIGLGNMFGFKFPENFNYPYISKSIKEFWRRWHISLSSWFRDYLYIPLGGNRINASRTYFNLITVFFLTGLWHGASWSFVVWGLYHGFFLILERIGLERALNKVGFFVGNAYALVVVIIGWVFFRADNFPYAWSYLKAMFGLDNPSKEKFNFAYYMDNEIALTLIAGIVLSMPLFFKLKTLRAKLFNVIPGTIFQMSLNGLITVLYIVLFIWSVIYISSDTYNPFIYFRF
ncbi:MAG: MBOAT family protein [Bacteroidia bacterium]|nr:MBOAT family protein [Bacteroidia bacterium]NNC85151.1 MBOAT family protein [Bacteroidia bacterium]NNM15458.1 MBOAT family protein [Bacteroidia bacterium]